MSSNESSSRIFIVSFAQAPRASLTHWRRASAFAHVHRCGLCADCVLHRWRKWKNKLKLHINIVCTMHNAVHSTILRWCASATPAFFQPIALMRTNNEDDDKCFAAQQHDDWRQWVRKFEWAKSNSLIHLAQPPSFCINISIDCFGVCVRACVLWALCKNVQYINNFLFLIHLFCSGRLTWLRPPSAMQPPFVAQKVMNINNAKRLTPYIFSLSRYRPNLFYIFRITGGPWTLQSQLYRHVYFLNINFSGQKKKTKPIILFTPFHLGVLGC